jgi:hypothetical protein
VIAAVSIIAAVAPAWCQDDDTVPVAEPATAPVAASTGTWFELSADIGYTFGETEYIYDQTFADLGRDVRLKSQLEFPLDAPLIGVRGQLGTRWHGRPFVGELTVHTNLADPSGMMYDHDWIWGLVGFNGKFSYTESNVTGNLWQLGVAASWHLAESERAGFGPHAGYRYQRISQDVIDFTGWQIDIERPPYQPQPLSADTLGIVYRVTYHMIVLGADTRLRLVGDLHATLRGALVPFHFSDFDDHVLRFKTAEASGWGLGGLVQLGTSWPLGNPSRRVRPVVAARFDLLALAADGPQTQTWYGDDPASEGDDTGTTITDLPHEVNSTQYHLMLGVGAAF